jgi:hypothetical protein
MLTVCLRTIVSRAAGRGELPEGSDIELLWQLPLSLLQNWRLKQGQNRATPLSSGSSPSSTAPARP